MVSTKNLNAAPTPDAADAAEGEGGDAAAEGREKAKRLSGHFGGGVAESTISFTRHQHSQQHAMGLTEEAPAHQNGPSKGTPISCDGTIPADIM
jgi:hypothetical protein